jgi:hypothetical protein
MASHNMEQPLYSEVTLAERWRTLDPGGVDITELAPRWVAAGRIGLPVVARTPLGRFRNLAALVLHGE